MGKLPLLQQLLQECAEISTTDPTNVDEVCQFKNKKEGEEFLAMFLQHAEHIEKELETDKKELEEEKQTNPNTPRKPTTILIILKKLMTAKSINSSQNKISATKAFLEELKKFIDASATTSEPIDASVKAQVEELIKHYTDELTKSTSAPAP